MNNWIIEKRIKELEKNYIFWTNFEEDIVQEKILVDNFIVYDGKSKRIQKYCVSALAQILYECVECEENPRDKVDWLTAEKFLNYNFDEFQWRRIIQRDICLRVYDSIRGSNPNLPEINQTIVNNNWEGFGYYQAILMEIAFCDDRFFVEATKSDDNMNLYIRRLIWDWGYQKLKEDLKPPYGRIRFH